MTPDQQTPHPLPPQNLTPQHSLQTPYHHLHHHSSNTTLPHDRKRMARPLVPSRAVRDLLLPPQPLPASHLVRIVRAALAAITQEHSSLKIADAQAHARFSRARDEFDDGEVLARSGGTGGWGRDGTSAVEDAGSDSGFESGVCSGDEGLGKRGVEEWCRLGRTARDREREWRAGRERVRLCEWDLLTLEADVSLL